MPLKGVWNSLRRILKRSEPQNAPRTAKETPSTTLEGDQRPVKAGWKPLTLRPPLLFALIIFLLSLIVLLEYLSQISKERQGLAMTFTHFSPAITFLYLYLPTILAVLINLVWSWIDLDAKRLEPYFQMSKKGGARLEDSLDLHYPFDFVAWAPLKAVRKRHWAVATSGAAMLLVFWVVTPLISTIFAVEDVQLRATREAHSTMTLSPYQDQVRDLSNHFLAVAYRHIWTGEPLPPFTTNDSALFPVTLTDNVASHAHQCNWTTETVLLSTTLSCTPVNSDPSQNTTYNDKNGCEVEIDTSTSQLTALYFGFFASLYNDYYLSNREGCSDLSNEHKFFGIWHDPNDESLAPTALFCEPSYWQQRVQIDVLAHNGSIIDIRPLEDRVPLPEKAFNVTNFEYVLNAGSPQVSKRADIIDTYTDISHKWRLQNAMGIDLDLRTMLMDVGLAVTQLPVSEYANPEVLARSLEKAHQLLFALAIQSLLLEESSGPARANGIETYRTWSITVVRPLAMVLEVILGCIATLMLALMWICRTRRIQLSRDPASIENILEMSSSSVHTSDGLFAREQHRDIMRACLSDHRIELIILSPSKSSPHSLGEIDRQSIPTDKTCLQAAVTKNQQPWEVRIATGVAFLMLLALFFALLTVSWILSSRHSGLAIPSGSAAVTQLLTSYLPVAFATLLEPFWTLLNRNLCVRQPLKTLSKRGVSISRSLGLRYTSLPPQLAFWRALKARDGMLAMVCAIGLSTNVLAVALGGLISTQQLTQRTEMKMSREFLPKFSKANNDSGFGPDPGIFFVSGSSISNPSTLPPWTNNETFFTPFNLDESLKFRENRTFTSNTIGFSLDIKCRPVDYNSTAFIYMPSSRSGPRDVVLKDGQSCAPPQTGVFGGHNLRISAFETLSQLKDKPQDKPGPCSNNFLAGFLRGNLSVSQDSTKTDNIIDGGDEERPEISQVHSLSSTWMTCEQALQVAMYTVTVMSDGRVHHAERTHAFQTDNANFFEQPINESIFLNGTAQVYQGGSTVPFWHNDTYVDSWFGYLVKLVSPTAIDPLRPVPTYEQAHPLVEGILRRAFAIQLGLNTQWLAKAPVGSVASGTTSTAEARLAISKPAFIISVTLLSLNIFVCCLYYFRRPHQLSLPVPTSIGSILRLFAGSSLIQNQSPRHALPRDTSIRYGKYVGVDGKPHLGIDKAAVVIGA